MSDSKLNTYGPMASWSLRRRFSLTSRGRDVILDADKWRWILRHGGARRKLSEGTLENYYRVNSRRVEDLSPRVRMALRLYVHGVVKTQGEACRLAGLTQAYFSQVVNSPAGREYMKSAHNIIEENAHDVNLLIRKLSGRAIEVIGTMMEDASKEDVRLKAAQDLADRGPETAKIHKHQVESFTLSGEDARAIAESMVQAAAVRNSFVTLKTDNFDRVNVDEEPEVLADEQLPLTPVQLTLMES